MDACARLRQFRDGAADIDHVPARPVAPGDERNVATFHPFERSGEALALRKGRCPGHGLRDDPVRLDAEHRCLGLLDLGSEILAGVLDAGAGKGSEHGPPLREIAVRN